jgi:hypothetical protein
VLVTAVLVRWPGVTWKALLIPAVAMTVASYLLAGLLPRSIGRYSPASARSGASRLD